MKNLLTLLFFLAGPALAQGVSVKSGEHGAFTRLVFTYPAPVDWVLGRTPGGYALRIAGPGLSYDLSSVYRLITRDRLRSVWVDPANGDLSLGVDCPCHAIPFELNARILVIDIRDGPPPANSGFELSIADGTAFPPIQATRTPRPRRNTRRDASYDWLDRTTAATRTAPASSPASPVTAGLDNDLRLEDFRSMLIDQVGRGATQGVVEMERPRAPAGPVADLPADALPDNARAAVHALPGIGISTDAASRPDLMVQGETCPAAADLDVGAWAMTADATAELTRARAALLTEFDVPDPERVLLAVNTHLHFGFGAEARQLLVSFLPAGRTDALRTGLSYLIEGDRPSENPFRAMQSCNSAAALWALLAAPADEMQSYINGAAVSRTFLSLPPHLRAALGPEVAKRLLRSGDSANAEVVRQAFERAAPDGDPTVDLLTADQALQSGDPAAAEAALPTDAMGETAMATLFTLVEARFQQRKPVDGKDILALEAFAFEHGNGPLRPQFDRALAHGSALAGNFTAAFNRAQGWPALEQDVWMLLAGTGAESQLLTFAVGLDPSRRAALPPGTRSQIAARLVDAGLPNAAADWAQTGGLEAGLAARVALSNGDARGALRLLSAQLPEADPALLAASYTALGDYDAAASVYEAAGDTGAAARLRHWAGTEPEAGTTPLPDTPSDPWTTLAGLTGPANPASAPPLQASFARLDQSAATRQAIADLLAAAPMVSAGMPP